MRVLLDESVPRRLKSLLPDHDVSTVQEVGWAGLDHGELLERAAAFDAFVTADQGIEHEQHLGRLSVGVVLLIASSNRFDAYLPLAEDSVRAVISGRAGELIKVAAQHL